MTGFLLAAAAPSQLQPTFISLPQQISSQLFSGGNYAIFIYIVPASLRLPGLRWPPFRYDARYFGRPHGLDTAWVGCEQVNSRVRCLRPEHL